MMRKVMVMLWIVISLPIVIVMVLFEALLKLFMDKRKKEDSEMEKLRVFTAFSGYDSRCLALEQGNEEQQLKLF